MKTIKIRGARQHNLKNIDVDIPHHQLVVLTGLSGSGKSTLAFDTLYAEGQRRYVESLSAYARQFLERMGKPDVDLIEGLSPAIAIDQKTAGHNPRSTVGTVTEIYDYLRLLYARVGAIHCHQCGRPITSQSVDQMVDTIARYPEATKLIILSPVVQNEEGAHTSMINKLRRDGFARIRIDGEVQDIASVDKIPASNRHTIEVVVDRLVLKPDLRNRLADSLELALSISEGSVFVELLPPQSGIVWEVLQFSERPVCPDCRMPSPELTPASFSFNSPHGACPQCAGLGTSFEDAKAFDGRMVQLQRRYRETDSGQVREELENHMTQYPCTACGGSRIRPESRAVKVGGLGIHQLTQLSIAKALSFFRDLTLNGQRALIAGKITRKVIERLEFLQDVGLSYLCLDRAAHTLSGGESQRIRLATQMGAKLTGVLYVLDEPSIGLHARDTQKLRTTLFKMRDLGNTVLVVEHDPETIMSADYVIDMGPGAGVKGGDIVFSGIPDALLHSKASITGQYLSGRLTIPLPPVRRSGNGQYLIIKGAEQNNLKKIAAKFPLGTLVCVTGVSGSGKSSLVIETLFKALQQHLYRTKQTCGRHAGIEGLEHIDKVINIDQTPIGRTPRSNPATYTGTFKFMRDLYSRTADARVRGYKPGRFSFNVKGGRCESCKGEGIVKIEMHFLPDIYVPCDVCHGKCYNRETLEVRYKGKNIAEVLDMTVNQSLGFFQRIGPIRDRLQTLVDVGLGYIHMGQAATTLSGGEAQRVKLARELSKRNTGRTLYLLDEPTTGLHLEDINKLLLVLNRLVDNGNTVIIIEHNLDVIKTADHIIDLGPEGGDGGGFIVASGTPEELVMAENSYTGQYLRTLFDM